MYIYNHAIKKKKILMIRVALLSTVTKMQKNYGQNSIVIFIVKWCGGSYLKIYDGGVFSFVKWQKIADGDFIDIYNVLIKWNHRHSNVTLTYISYKAT